VFASRYLPNVVALLGAHTGIGQTRLSKLLRWCRSVVLLLDGDEAGQEAAEYLSEVLRPYLTVMTATLPEGSDPASLGASELLGAIRNIQYF
jgi:DNA primase